MYEYLVPALILLAVILVAWFVRIYLISGGNVSRYFAAQALAGRWLREPAFAAKVDELNQPPKPAAPPKPNPDPVLILSLLQREGRLIDFLLEDIQAYSDQDIGAGVRDIQRQCKKALLDHLVLEPVLKQDEKATVVVPTGFDPSAIRLTGNVTGQPPFQGTLQHHGWRVKEIKLSRPPEGQDAFVIQPAEVELT